MEIGPMLNLIRYTDSLRYDEEPDYSYYIKVLVEELSTMGTEFSWKMDWSINSTAWKISLSNNWEYLSTLEQRIMNFKN
jgi:hypothetical protein